MIPFNRLKADSCSTNNLPDTLLVRATVGNSPIDTLNVKMIECKTEQSKKWDFFPVFTLLLGFLLNRGYDYFLERRRIKKEGERWIAELRSLVKPIDEQKISIESFLESHQVDKFKTPELFIHQILDGEIFKSLDKSKLLKYLKSKSENFDKAVEKSNNIHGFISSLSFVYNDLTKRFNDYTEETSKHVDLFNEHLNQLSQSFDYYGINIEKRTGKDPTIDSVYSQILNLFSEHVVPHSEDGKIELFSFQIKFTKPLAEIVSTHRLNEDLKEISQLNSYCNTDIKAIRMEKRYLTENFKNSIKYLQKSNDSLKELIKENE